MNEFDVGNFTLGENQPLALICGPCVIESEDKTLFSAQFLKNLCEKLGIPLIFKSSYDKANRSSVHSYRGPGIDQGLFILERVKKEFDVPVVTDVHSPMEALSAAQVCDVLQIPAFLSRQTDLIVAAGQTGRVVKVKKGQFMAPWDMKPVVEKIESTGNKKIILTDRGTSFGYNNLVSDMRAIPIMHSLGYPVCYDATHSVQLPGGRGSSSGGQREFVETLAKSAIAAGANCLFLEAHQNPSEAMSDKESQIPFDELEKLLKTLLRISRAVREEDSAYV
ncbi:MAG: 3-deoxy-8-phosphooctulonate synthase [Simkaniaceae bacterium]|nr:3-deoxy-8-phosphooctulonate synthase [Candidatus Sacchlamyda saccharinae]